MTRRGRLGAAVDGTAAERGKQTALSSAGASSPRRAGRAAISTCAGRRVVQIAAGIPNSDSAVIVAAEEWERKARRKGNLAEFLAASPFRGSGPKLKRLPLRLRGIEL